MNSRLLSIVALCFSLTACALPPPMYHASRSEARPLVFSNPRYTALAAAQNTPSQYGVADGGTPLYDATRYQTVPSSLASSAAPTPTAGDPAYAPFIYSTSPPPSPTYAASSAGTYTGNCMYPDDLDSAGRRCGARSAYSRPGGYEPTLTYSSYGGGGTTRVRSYYRKDGTFVRSHTRRRR